MGKMIDTTVVPVITKPLVVTDRIFGNDVSENGATGELVQIPISVLKDLLLGIGVDVGGTASGDIVTIDGVQTMTGKTLTGAAIDATSQCVINGVSTPLGAAVHAKADNSTVTAALAAKADASTTTASLATKATTVGVATLSTTLKISTGSGVTTDEVTPTEIFAALGIAGIDQTTHNILARTVVMNLSKWFSTYCETISLGTKGGTIPSASTTFSGSGGTEPLTKVDLAGLEASTDYSLTLSFKVVAK